MCGNHSCAGFDGLFSRERAMRQRRGFLCFFAGNRTNHWLGLGTNRQYRQWEIQRWYFQGRSMPNRLCKRLFSLKTKRGILYKKAASSRYWRPGKPYRQRLQATFLPNQRLENCLARRALRRPTFLRSTSRASRVMNPALERSGFRALS